jgi:hypothetical protein
VAGLHWKLQTVLWAAKRAALVGTRLAAGLWQHLAQHGQRGFVQTGADEAIADRQPMLRGKVFDDEVWQVASGR